MRRITRLVCLVYFLARANAAVPSPQSVQSTPTLAPTTPGSVSGAPWPIVTYPSGVKFPPVGKVPRDYSQAGWERLWDVVSYSCIRFGLKLIRALDWSS